MCRSSRIALILTVTVLASSPALGQQPAEGQGQSVNGRFQGARLLLLGNPGVQQELKLTDEQIKKANAVTQAIRVKQTAESAKLREADPAERRAKLRKLNEMLAAEIKTGLDGVLTAEQEKRLAQIDLQQLGVQAFQDPDVQKALNITAEQKQSLKTIIEEYRKEMDEINRSVFQGRQGRGNRGGFAKVTAVSRAALDKALAVLTDSQKKQWKEMTGTPFKVTFRAERRGGP